MTNNEQIIRDFIGAWSRLDPVELANCSPPTAATAICQLSL